MTAFLDISAALDGRLDDLIGKPPIAWPNREYERTKGTLFARPTVIFGDVTRATVGSVAKDYYPGIYQVDVFAPAGEGKNEGFTMADTVADQFKRGTLIVQNSRTITCLDVDLLQPQQDDGWLIFPVQVSFYSLTNAR